MIPDLVFLLPSIPVFGLLVLFYRLSTIYRNSPKIESEKEDNECLFDKEITIVIPTYNEELNIDKCLTSVINSKKPPKGISLLIVDDLSSDNTINVANSVMRELELTGISFDIISAGPRPKYKKWVGKNWACAFASEKVKSEWILFLDADVILQKDTLIKALTFAVKNNIDLLSLAPRVTCKCFSEWLIQPIIVILLGLGFPLSKVNDPIYSIAFAAGPFMLFSLNSYREIGGHAKVADKVAEDIELAKNIKRNGYKLNLLLGLDSIELNMYHDFSSIWEGWTKNWFLGLDRNIFNLFCSSIIIFCFFSLPWISIFASFVFSFNNNSLLLWLFLPSLLSILIQYKLRNWLNINFKLPNNYWWLMGLGGMIVALIGPVSCWKTITGMNWTWKGRLLS